MRGAEDGSEPRCCKSCRAIRAQTTRRLSSRRAVLEKGPRLLRRYWYIYRALKWPARPAQSAQTSLLFPI
jgi:hypothetical protein